MSFNGNEALKLKYLLTAILENTVSVQSTTFLSAQQTPQ